MTNNKTSKVTRLEIIDHTKPSEDGGGRTVVFDRDGKQVELSYQDEGRTLKIFITEVKQTLQAGGER